MLQIERGFKAGHCPCYEIMQPEGKIRKFFFCFNVTQRFFSLFSLPIIQNESGVF